MLRFCLCSLSCFVAFFFDVLSYTPWCDTFSPCHVGSVSVHSYRTGLEWLLAGNHLGYLIYITPRKKDGIPFSLPTAHSSHSRPSCLLNRRLRNVMTLPHRTSRLRWTSFYQSSPPEKEDLYISRLPAVPGPPVFLRILRQGERKPAQLGSSCASWPRLPIHE